MVGIASVNCSSTIAKATPSGPVASITEQFIIKTKHPRFSIRSGPHYVTGLNLRHRTWDSEGGSPPGGGGGGPSDDSGLLSGASMRQLEIPLALIPKTRPDPLEQRSQHKNGVQWWR
ncbi:hypothetical protein GWI33_022134 [Rhynchophorus ferrugineus]|uniref:Uncharacterized protein n=1 Tax=Rhynchophorus ferrugineus TaxID=354439 RepID=A0A834LZD6_RHYFE|nr:hypothetical protein GWI33_022136 [Rhynchophorus ferrugineus]KAF7264840.1 hypothetical protein GWI33_022134 [Rhynchophorus ferrugineus]